ncbi:AMOP: sushi: nidogen and VWD domain-containing protein-like protein, partial [Dinothrombium tinctorium]
EDATEEPDIEPDSLLYPLGKFLNLNSLHQLHDEALTFRIPYFGFSFHYIWVHKDGYVTFNRGLKSYSFPLSFPLSPEHPEVEEDPSLIAIFFASQDVSREVPGSGVYMKIVDFSNNFDLKLKKRLLDDLENSMPSSVGFRPSHVVIVTWKNMTFSNWKREKPLKTNTYQMVIATNEVQTFIIYNYEWISWITHYDHYEGLNGPAAYVGFNSGNQTRTFEFVPFSQNARVSLLPSMGFGNGLKGRYYFSVEEEIHPGACIHKDLDPQLTDRQDLTTSTNWIYMLGGELLNVTGPCVEETDEIDCTFETKQVPGKFFDRNKIGCVVPPLMYEGYIDLTVTVKGRTSFYARMYVQSPEVKRYFDVNMVENEIYESGFLNTTKHSHATIIWKNEALSWDPRATVTISLWGYKEGNAMPLAWFMEKIWRREYGNRWNEIFCNQWADIEANSLHFATTLFRCPCTGQQALIDRVRFAPHLLCNLIDKKCDSMHHGAHFCIRSSRPSVGGSGQTCCYDDQLELMQTADTMFGGRPSRSFIHGKHPYKMKHMVPALSYWHHDVTPFYYCCKWAKDKENSESCQTYNYWRTSQDCSSYHPPGIASVFGDPHIVTFDKVNYTFNAKGEFVLVHVDDNVRKLFIQGKFEQLENTEGTHLTAVAVRDNISSIVEFRLRPKAARWQYQIYVIADKEFYYFWNEQMRFLNLPGVSIYQPSEIRNMSHIIAMFDSGAGVEVMVTTGGSLLLNVYLPDTFINRTAGLLGKWSRNPSDDLMLPDKRTIPLARLYSMQNVHNEFASHWRLTEIDQKHIGRSLFWHNVLPHSEIDDRKYTPPFEVELDERSAKIAERVCSSSKACAYDYMITKDESYALSTQRSEAFVHHIKDIADSSFLRCPALPKPRNGRKSENRYWPGVIVTFVCDKGYRLFGHEARYCRHDGMWSWGEDPRCIPET